MTYIRKTQCPTCKKPHWFHYWPGTFCDKSVSGLCVTDFDLLFHRFKRSTDRLGTRSIEHLMIIEVKIGDEKLRPPQRDTLSVFNGLLKTFVPVNGRPLLVSSRPGFISKNEKKVIWHGVHLLRVPVEENNLGPFVFDGHDIPFGTLQGILNFDLNANHPHRKLDIERRHKSSPPPLPLLGGPQ